MKINKKKETLNFLNLYNRTDRNFFIFLETNKHIKVI